MAGNRRIHPEGSTCPRGSREPRRPDGGAGSWVPQRRRLHLREVALLRIQGQSGVLSESGVPLVQRLASPSFTKDQPPSVTSNHVLSSDDRLHRLLSTLCDLEGALSVFAFGCHLCPGGCAPGARLRQPGESSEDGVGWSPRLLGHRKCIRFPCSDVSRSSSVSLKVSSYLAQGDSGYLSAECVQVRYASSMTDVIWVYRLSHAMCGFRRRPSYCNVSLPR